MNHKIFIILCFNIFILYSCKDSAQPQPADCDLGYHPCDYDETICCPDTTSHNFSWEIDTLGIYGSVINDVAIVDENNVWVVGDIETENGEYNAAHWNGSDWELLGIYSNTLDLYNIKYFSENDIWVTSSGFPIHWDGISWTLHHLQNMGIHVSVGYGIWGTSSSEIYFIGLNGAIVHYNGSSFTQLESSTDVKLIDIDGTDDGGHVFIAGRDDIGTSVALMIHNNQVSTLYEGEGALSEPYGVILNVSIDNNTAYFSTSKLLWKYNFRTENSVTVPGDEIFFENRTTKKIVVHNQSDVFIMTNWAELIHYNGNNWNLDPFVLDVYGPFNVYTRSLAFKDEMVIITGYCCGGGHAIVARGYR